MRDRNIFQFSLSISFFVVSHPQSFSFKLKASGKERSVSGTPRTKVILLFLKSVRLALTAACCCFGERLIFFELASRLTIKSAAVKISNIVHCRGNTVYPPSAIKAGEATKLTPLWDFLLSVWPVCALYKLTGERRWSQKRRHQKSLVPLPILAFSRKRFFLSGELRCNLSPGQSINDKRMRRVLYFWTVKSSSYLGGEDDTHVA